MAKAHALNGYVDAIAFTWGSQLAASQDRLKKTGWLGHCLLRPTDRALERLYLALATSTARFCTTISKPVHLHEGLAFPGFSAGVAPSEPYIPPPRRPSKGERPIVSRRAGLMGLGSENCAAPIVLSKVGKL